MKRWIQRVMHPSWYHGHHKKRRFFEGWYYKLVDAAEQHPLALIPGIFLAEKDDNHHAFLQVLDGRNGEVHYLRFPTAAFNAAKDRFHLALGDDKTGVSHFNAEAVELGYQSAEATLSGQVHFRNTVSWPVTWRSPGIMGWYAWIPLMECFHGVVSLDHTLEGNLVLNGEMLDFTGGRGYIEKDWGQAFPSSWVWVQSNHFTTPGTCLTASVAMIPWFGTRFRGFIVGFWHEGVLHRFTTYTGTKIEKFQVSDKTVDWVLRNKTHRLSLRIHRSDNHGLLLAPRRTDMLPVVRESLAGEVDVQLSVLRGAQETLLFEEQGRHAGLEVEGELQALLKG